MAARDVIFIGVILLATALFFMIIYLVVQNMTAAFIAVPEIAANPDATAAFNANVDVVNKLDYVLFMIFIGLTLALIVTGWFIGGYPIFMFIYGFVMFFAVILGAILANVWETFSTNGSFATVITHFPITNFLLLKLPFVLAVIGFMGLVVMFGKPFLFGGGQQV